MGVEILLAGEYLHGREFPVQLRADHIGPVAVEDGVFPGVQVNDPVVLIGTDGEETITMEQIAEQAGSFNYEFVCGISRRVPRIYKHAGKVVAEVHYLLDT